MAKMQKVMHEFKEGTLHSGSDEGPQVTNRKQAIAIGMSEARKAGENVGPPPRAKAKRRARSKRRRSSSPTTAFTGTGFKSY